jgi:hypothetical protein
LPPADREEEQKGFMGDKYSVLVTTKEWLDRSALFTVVDE